MSKLRVYFSDEQSYMKITPDFKKLLTKVCKCTLKCADFNLGGEISISFVTNNAIKELNSRYRGIDSSTDVLSFPLSDGDEFDINPNNGLCMLGDIIISTERAASQAADFGHSTEREIAFLVVHSVLHLLGYDHPDEDGEMTRSMRQKEKQTMDMLGYRVKADEEISHPVHAIENS